MEFANFYERYNEFGISVNHPGRVALNCISTTNPHVYRYVNYVGFCAIARLYRDQHKVFARELAAGTPPLAF